LVAGLVNGRRTDRPTDHEPRRVPFPSAGILLDNKEAQGETTAAWYSTNYSNRAWFGDHPLWVVISVFPAADLPPRSAMWPSAAVALLAVWKAHGRPADRVRQRGLPTRNRGTDRSLRYALTTQGCAMRRTREAAFEKGPTRVVRRRKSVRSTDADRTEETRRPSACMNTDSCCRDCRVHGCRCLYSRLCAAVAAATTETG